MKIKIKIGQKNYGKHGCRNYRNLSKKILDKNKGYCYRSMSFSCWLGTKYCSGSKKGIVELPMTDVAGAGFAVGAALAGIRPIFILRFQSFLWLNASPIINHAAKSKEIFGYGAPVFIRAIASEGPSSGPIHTNCYHSPFAHMPGLPICAPMTPKEYNEIWNKYLKSDSPMLVSEHRRSYKESIEFKDEINKASRLTLFLISASRFEANKIKEKLKKKNTD